MMFCKDWVDTDLVSKGIRLWPCMETDPPRVAIHKGIDSMASYRHLREALGVDTHFSRSSFATHRFMGIFTGVLEICSESSGKITGVF